MQNGPVDSLLDGLGNAIGYAFVLLFVAFFRELFGSGTVFCFTILSPSTEGGWYPVNGFMVLAPSAALLIGCFIWIVRAWRPDLIEEDLHVGALFEPGDEGHLR